MARPTREDPLINIPRLLTMIAVVGAALIGLYVWYYVPLQIKSALEDKTGPMETRLTTLQSRTDFSDQRLARIELMLDGLVKSSLNKESLFRVLKQATVSDDFNKLRATLPTAQAFLQTAQEKGVILEPKQIAAIAVPLVDVSFQAPPAVRPIAWATVLQFGQYRSYVNQAVFAPVSTSQGKVEPFRPQLTDNAVIRGTVELDNKTINGDTYINSLIIYKGGPLSLKNVRFYGCQFNVTFGDAGAKFIRVLLLSSGPTVVFES